MPQIKLGKGARLDQSHYHVWTYIDLRIYTAMRLPMVRTQVAKEPASYGIYVVIAQSQLICSGLIRPRPRHSGWFRRRSIALLQAQ